MRQLLIPAALVCSLFAMPAAANTYIGIDGTSVTIEDNLDTDLNPLGLRFRVGVRLNENVDLEAHLGFSSDKRSSSYDDIGTSYGGAFLKGYVPIGFNSAFYALGGFSNVEITQTINGRDFTDDRYGFSYGFGLETKLSERADISADFVRYVRDEGLFEDISAVSLGLKFYF